MLQANEIHPQPRSTSASEHLFSIVPSQLSNWGRREEEKGKGNDDNDEEEDVEEEDEKEEDDGDDEDEDDLMSQKGRIKRETC